GRYRGRRLTAQFVLDLSDNLHHDLYLEALKGNLELLQTTLPHEQQGLAWEGDDKSYYYGIPWLIGRTKNHGHYVLTEDGELSELDVIGKRNNGILSPMRNHQRFVYQTDEGVVLYWLNEMKKVN